MRLVHGSTWVFLVCWITSFAAPRAVAVEEAATAAAASTGIETALNLQTAFSSVAEKASPAVVVITNKQRLRQPTAGQLPPEFRFFFGIPDEQEPIPAPNGNGVPRPVGKGSGVIISPDGYIVTNYHVIRNYDALEVRLHDGTTYDSYREDGAVELVGVDEDTDLAVLRIGGGNLQDLPWLQFADSDKVRVGEWVLAVGAPFNFDYSVTVGVVSQKGRYNVRMNTYESYIQTDASINPGNSGGPLLDLYGKVVGINDVIVTGGGMARGNIGLGFAISSNLVKQVVDQIIASGAVIRPWLGIAMQELTPELQQQFGAESGVLVSDVTPGDPAAEAGLKAGDVIVQVGEKAVQTPHDVQFAVLAYQPGDEIALTILRQGEQRQVTVVARRKDTVAATGGANGDLLKNLGLLLETADEGVMVTGVAAGSAAGAAGIQRGDIIREVNRTKVDSVDAVTAALDKTRNGVALFYIERRGEKMFVTVNVSAEER